MDENQNEPINQEPVTNVDPVTNTENTVNVTSYSVDGTERTNASTTNTTQNGSGRTGLTTASLVLGILSLMPCCCWNYVGLLFGVLAIIFNVVGKDNAGEQGKKDGKAGMICGIIGVVIFIIAWITFKIIFVRFFGAIVEFLREHFDTIDWEGISESVDVEGLMNTITENISN